MEIWWFLRYSTASGKLQNFNPNFSPSNNELHPVQSNELNKKVNEISPKVANFFEYRLRYQRFLVNKTLLLSNVILLGC